MLHFMPTALQSSPRLLTVRQLQELLHIDRSTIYRMASDGRLPSVRVGKQLRFPAAEISSLLASQPGDSVTGIAAAALNPAAATAAIEVASQLLGVMMVATDMAGHPITPIVNQCPWFAAHASDTETLESCLNEWRVMAADTDLAPRFRIGSLGYECARVFIRSGSALVGMIIAGGVAPTEEHGVADGLIHLDASQRQRVLDTLPVVARAIALAQPASGSDDNISSVPPSSIPGAQTQGEL